MDKDWSDKNKEFQNWCGKNIAGLLKKPFSRHWIMHIEAMRRIKNKLCKLEIYKS